MIEKYLWVLKQINYFYYVRNQIIRVLVNLDKNGIVFVMDIGLFNLLKLYSVLLLYFYIILLYCRWRKHKCNMKKHNRLLNGLNSCTCISTDGHFYTKLGINKNHNHNLK